MKEQNRSMKQNDQKNNKSAVLKRIALCIFIVAVLGIVVLVIRDLVHTKEQQEQMEELRAEVAEDLGTVEAVDQANEEVEATEEPTIEPTTEPTPEPVYNPYVNLFEENEDMIAWIQIDDTKIDLPVVQTMEDEDEYLFLGFDGNYNVNGTLLLDTDSHVDKPSTNMIIHGHNMKSGQMFGDLDLYADETYAKDHEIISMYYKNIKKEYQVMAVFYSQVYKKSDDVFKFYKFFEATNEEEFNDFYDNCIELSIFDTGVDAEFGDEFLTLSTCSYQVDNGRFVVVAKKIDEEEMLYEAVDEE